MSNSDYSSLDFNRISPVKKSHREINFNSSEPPTPLNPLNFTITSNQKLRLPKLLSPRFSNQLISKFGLQQLKIEDITVERRSQSLPQPMKNNSTLLQQSNKRERADSSTPIPAISKVKNSNNVKNFSQIAEDLKHRGEAKFNLKFYKEAILNFTNSYLLFILSFYIKEQSQSYSSTTLREKDWLSLLKFSNRVIARFSEILDRKKESDKDKDKDKDKEKDKDRERDRVYGIYTNDVIGLLNYTNAFLVQHLVEMTEEVIARLIDKNEHNQLNDQDVDRLIFLNKKLIRLDKSVKNYMKKGDLRLGLFIIAKRYPQLWGRSLTQLNNVRTNEVVLPGKRGPWEFDYGVNYCLPVCSHSFNLITIFNFGFYFLKEWSELEKIDNYDWCFEF